VAKKLIAGSPKRVPIWRTPLANPRSTRRRNSAGGSPCRTRCGPALGPCGAGLPDGFHEHEAHHAPADGCSPCRLRPDEDAAGPLIPCRISYPGPPRAESLRAAARRSLRRPAGNRGRQEPDATCYQIRLVSNLVWLVGSSVSPLSPLAAPGWPGSTIHPRPQVRRRSTLQRSAESGATQGCVEQSFALQAAEPIVHRLPRAMLLRHVAPHGAPGVKACLGLISR